MITRGGKRINWITAQCTRHCSALVLWNPPQSLFSTFLAFLQCNLTTVAVFLNLSLVVDFSILFLCVCKVLLILSPHFHFFCPYSFCLFLVCDSLLFVHSCCLRKSVCWISYCLILPHHSTHLVLVADCCIKFSSLFVASFLLLVYWHVVYFQQPKTNSPPPLHAQLSLGSMRFAHQLSGWSGGLVVQPVLILSNFSARPGAALKFGYQSSVKASENKKKLVQRVLVLLWQKVQHGGGSPLMWTWTWRTQQRSGHGWHFSCWM